MEKYQQEGAQGLIDKKTGSNKKPVRSKEVVNQIIPLRFLDPFASAAGLAQKLTQIGHKVSIRSVERTITEFGLKKTHSLSPKNEKKRKEIEIQISKREKVKVQVNGRFKLITKKSPIAIVDSVNQRSILLKIRPYILSIYLYMNKKET